jgi:hypothetical protein
MAELFDQRVHIPPASAFSIQKHRSALWLLIWLNVILRYRHKAASICFKSITGRDAEAYSDALAVRTLDPERSDVLSKI